MNAYEQAALCYANHGPLPTLEADLWHHLMHGTVYCSPTCFLMVRPVCSAWDVERLNDPTQTDPDGDTWFIWFLLGDMSQIWNILTPKKFIAYGRRGVLRWRRYDRIRRLQLATAMGDAGSVLPAV